MLNTTQFRDITEMAVAGQRKSPVSANTGRRGGSYEETLGSDGKVLSVAVSTPCSDQMDNPTK
jgi:hypothetical protein